MNEFQPLDAPDLSECAREPIHIPEAIQPHGVLLAVDAGSRRILRAAGACPALLGRSTRSCLEADAAAVLGPEGAALLAPFWQEPLSEPALLGSLAPLHAGGPPLDLTAHLSQGMAILELEPAGGRPVGAAAMLAEIRRAGARLQAAAGMPALLRTAADLVRAAIGYDRVMVYRFLEDESGTVAAEAKADGLPPLLNHRYPASDIPAQARALYLRNPIRVIPDAGYAPAPVLSAEGVPAVPLDMSDCVLRSVSPVHLQYLRNMGVTASASVSIVVRGRLWGLIACHHGRPGFLSYDRREFCTHVGQMLALQIQARQEAEQHRQTARLAEHRDRAMQRLGGSGSLAEHLVAAPEDLWPALPADGFAVRHGAVLARAGRAPDAAACLAVSDWLLRRDAPERFLTASLAAEMPGAAAFAARGSGLAAILLSREPALVLMWFRAEEVETVEWAGNPHKAVELATGAGGGDRPRRLTPRHSFEVWKEEVRNRARAWSRPEAEALRRLARSLAELRRQEAVADLNRHLRRALAEQEILLEQKDVLLREVHHRVQNSLQLVNSMLYLQARQAGDPQSRALFEEASNRILAVAKIHQRLWRSDQIEQVELGSYLEELRDGLIESWGPDWTDCITVEAAPVTVPTHTAVILALVVTELLTNAVKYAYGGDVGPVLVRLAVEGRAIRLVVSDEGVGMPGTVSAEGLGSRLTRTLIAQLGGALEMPRRQAGTAIHLVVPRDAAAPEAG